MGYSYVNIGEAATTRSGKSGTPTVDLVERLGFEKMRPTLRILEPGGTMLYHRHDQQEELYCLLSGSGTLVLDEERLTVDEGTVIRVTPEVPRQVVNDSDGESVWLIVGAPPVTGDGTPLSPD